MATPPTAGPALLAKCRGLASRECRRRGDGGGGHREPRECAQNLIHFHSFSQRERDLDGHVVATRCILREDAAAIFDDASLERRRDEDVVEPHEEKPARRHKLRRPARLGRPSELVGEAALEQSAESAARVLDFQIRVEVAAHDYSVEPFAQSVEVRDERGTQRVTAAAFAAACTSPGSGGRMLW